MERLVSPNVKSMVRKGPLNLEIMRAFYTEASNFLHDSKWMRKEQWWFHKKKEEEEDNKNKWLVS